MQAKNRDSLVDCAFTLRIGEMERVIGGFDGGRSPREPKNLEWPPLRRDPGLFTMRQAKALEGFIDGVAWVTHVPRRLVGNVVMDLVIRLRTD